MGVKAEALTALGKNLPIDDVANSLLKLINGAKDTPVQPVIRQADTSPPIVGHRTEELDLSNAADLAKQNQLYRERSIQAADSRSNATDEVLIQNNPRKPTFNVGSTRAERKNVDQGVANWLIRERQRVGGSSADIDRSQIGEIIIGGEPRQISGITRFFKNLDKAGGDLSKLTKKSDWFDLPSTSNLEKRSVLETPPIEELNSFAQRHGIDTQVVADYYRWAKRGFGSVKAAAARMNLFDKMPRKWHAGHLTAAATEVPGDAQWLWRSKNSRLGLPPTTGANAVIELGADNISGLNRLDHNINPWVAYLTDTPMSWIQDFRRYQRIMNGQPYGSLKADWSLAEQNELLSIPYHYSKEQVEKVIQKLIKKAQKDPNHWTHQHKAVQRDARIDRVNAASADNPDYYLNDPTAAGYRKPTFMDVDSDSGVVKGESKVRRKKVKEKEISTRDYLKAFKNR